MKGGPTGRMLTVSALLALIVGAAFSVLLSSIADLRAAERRARQSSPPPAASPDRSCSSPHSPVS